MESTKWIYTKILLDNLNYMLKNTKLFSLPILFLAMFYGGNVAAISISPPVMEIDITSGNSVERTIEVGNETDQEKFYAVGIGKFEMVGEEGYQKFLPIEEGNDFGVASWIKYEENNIVVPPRGSKKFMFTIDVPENADPGGHYASIHFSIGKPTEEDAEDSMVGVEAQIHSLILVRVAGDIIEKAEIESFGIKDDKTPINRFPVALVWKLKNSGNVHIRAQGNIEIKDMFGRRVELIDANPKNYRALPGATRKIEAWWGDMSDFDNNDESSSFFQEAKKEFSNFAIGKYSAKLDIVYGDGNKNFLSEEISFWMIPWRVLLIALIMFAVLAVVIILFVKRYNKWIVKKHLGKDEEKQAE